MRMKRTGPAALALASLSFMASLVVLSSLIFAQAAPAGFIDRTYLPDWYPQALALDDRTGRVFVAEGDRNQVGVLDLHTGALLHSVHVGANPVALAADTRRGLVFVANQDDDSASVLDARNGQVLRTVPLHLSAYKGQSLAITGLAIDQVHGRLFVTGGTGRVSMLDTLSGGVVRTASGLPSSSTTLGGPLIWDGGRRLYLLQPSVTGTSGTVSVLDAGNLALLRTIGVGPDAQHIAVDGHLTRLFVVGSHTLRLLDSRSGRLLRQVPLPALFATPAVDTRTGRLFVAGAEGRSITTIDSRTGAVLGTVRVSWLTGALALDPTRRHLYVPTVAGVTVLDSGTGNILGSLPGQEGATATVDQRTGRVFLASFGGQASELPGWVPARLLRLLSSPPERRPGSVTILDGGRC